MIICQKFDAKNMLQRLVIVHCQRFLVNKPGIKRAHKYDKMKKGVDGHENTKICTQQQTHLRRPRLTTQAKAGTAQLTVCLLVTDLPVTPDQRDRDNHTPWGTHITSLYCLTKVYV